ncbi:MAG TPA: hypothetical protein VH637_08195 [Streptosporangiaceae bacterium]|jgi:hypothetical protein
MTGSAADHRLVRGYLREADAAFSVLPRARARELREQIAAHLAEAVPGGSDDAQVEEVLRQLGAPRDLAAEAVATAGKRPWPARVGWRAWALIAAAAIVVGGPASYLIVMESAGPLFASGVSAWWYPQDGAREVRSAADFTGQTMVPERPGQRQGLAIQVYNVSGQTQTILGIAPGDENGPALSVIRAGVSTTDPDRAHDAMHALRYTPPPVSIPPGQSRILRLTWVSRDCLQSGDQAGMDAVTLRVRVGLFTRTEMVHFNEAFVIGAARYCPA